MVLMGLRLGFRIKIGFSVEDSDRVNGLGFRT